ncbi:MAG: Ig-like domain-containing protein [bacterium]
MKAKKLLKKISILGICAILISQVSFFAITSAQVKTISPQGQNNSLPKTDNFSTPAIERKEPILKQPMPKEPIANELRRNPMPTNAINKPLQSEKFKENFNEPVSAEIKNMEIREEQMRAEFKEQTKHDLIQTIEPKREFYPEGITPPICAEAKITSQSECEKLMMKKFEEEKRIETEKISNQKKINATTKNQPLNAQTNANTTNIKPKMEFFSEEKLNSEKNILPVPCQNKGIENKEKCFNFLKEAEGIPLKCREKGINDKEECDKIMRQTNLPPECQKAGFTDFEECKQNMNKNFLPPECVEKGITTPQECEKLMKEQKLPIECIRQGIAEEQKCHEMLFSLNMPFECTEAGITSREKCDEIMKIKSAAPECQEVGINDMRECEKMMMKLHMPMECQKAGITTPEECEKMMNKLRMPPECREAGIMDMKKCEKMMMKKYMPKECREANVETKEECEKIMVKKLMPKKCLEAGVATKQECEKIIIAQQDKIESIDFASNFPNECVDAQITDKEECKKALSKESFPLPCQENNIYQWKECRQFMEQKYMPQECAEAGATTEEECDSVMRQKHMPPECVEANAITKEDCDKVMETKYLSQECKNNGLATRKECDEYFMLKHMPKECFDENAQTPQECEQIMRQLHLAPECKTAGITDDAQCKEYMFNKYRPQEIKCEGLTNSECETELKENHLGLMIEDRKEKVRIKENFLPNVGKKIAFKKGKLTRVGDAGEEKNISKEKEAELIDVMPLKTDKELGINILPSKEKSLLKEDSNTITQSIPAIITIDSDQDGLPDDMEKRIGSDPNNADTDNDGYLDGEEVKNNFDPMGQGMFAQNMSPVDKAILNQETMEQPITDGEVKENIMQVNEILMPNVDEDNQENSFTISGTAIPNSMVSLYVYSGIAVLATVEADENGNWSHVFEQELKDGEHDIYATINDSEGKIEAKSNPKSFFIKEAKAVGINDFVSETMSETTQQIQETATKNNSNELLFIVLTIIMLGVLILMLRKVTRKTVGKIEK